MSKFLVEVEKHLSWTGHVEIEADDEEEAMELVVEKWMDQGKLKTEDVKWGESNEISFELTGNVDCVE